MRRWFGWVITFSMISIASASDNTLNLFTWSGVIPESIIQQFENETGIKVNFTTYDSNEFMYAKVKASITPVYDIVEPAGDLINRMRQKNMLEPLDKQKLTQFANLNPRFLNPAYDPGNQVSIPFIWGVTGIFINDAVYHPKDIQSWSSLWDKKYANQIMLLDDMREVFSIGLLTLGYSINDNNPKHIFAAYQKIKALHPNIKLFNSADNSILIDEDVPLGMVYNGEYVKSHHENSHLVFHYPTDGFTIWVDNFAILNNAPHKENAYRFLNFVLRADIAKSIALYNQYPTANLAAEKLLPDRIKNNPAIYPDDHTLRRGQIYTDLNQTALALYEKYWELLKLGG